MVSVDANLAPLGPSLPPPPPTRPAQAWFKSRHHIGKWLTHHKYTRNIPAILFMEVEPLPASEKVEGSKASYTSANGKQMTKNVPNI